MSSILHPPTWLNIIAYLHAYLQHLHSKNMQLGQFCGGFCSLDGTQRADYYEPFSYEKEGHIPYLSEEEKKNNITLCKEDLKLHQNMKDEKLKIVPIDIFRENHSIHLEPNSMYQKYLESMQKLGKIIVIPKFKFEVCVR